MVFKFILIKMKYMEKNIYNNNHNYNQKKNNIHMDK